MALQLLTGHDVLEHSQSGPFLAGWLALLARCPWAGACQHPDFIVPWYRLYQQAYLPVLVRDIGADGSLNGLLALALRPDGAALVGAGDQQAEYQAWLAPAAAGDMFIVAAVGVLGRAFPGIDLKLRYLPPGIPLAWVDADLRQRRRVSLRSHARPVMQVDPAAMERQRNKKNHRQNFNRLGRIGAVRFERVRDHGQFSACFDAMCMQYDFRQAALFHQMPFRSDPLKKVFQAELHRNGLLHTTVLLVGQDIAASHCGLAIQGGALQIGILAHNPAYAAHSPGLLLLAMLGVHLAHDNTPMLDLTPGGDAYKRQFATHHDTVFELIVHGSARRRLQSEALLHLKRLSKHCLHKAGYRPADVLLAMARLGQARATGPSHWWTLLRQRAGARPCSLRYRPRPDQPAGSDVRVSRNRLEDVFDFDARASLLSQWEFMGMVMQRMERLHDLYTCVQDGKLVLACWVQAGGEASAMVLSGLYVHRELGSGRLLQAFFEQLLRERTGSRPHASVHYQGRLDPASRALVAQCGFIEDSQWGQPS
jgi:CelD/BcsL family acetyltransferase involved in cellulose biosynthesis